MPILLPRRAPARSSGPASSGDVMKISCIPKDVSREAMVRDASLRTGLAVPPSGSCRPRVWLVD